MNKDTYSELCIAFDRLDRSTGDFERAIKHLRQFANLEGAAKHRELLTSIAEALQDAYLRVDKPMCVLDRLVDELAHST